GSTGIYRDIKVVDSFSIRSKNLNAISNIFIVFFKCIGKKYHIIHIHGTGPAILLPLFKLLKAKIVVHYHAEDHRRKKWGWFAKLMLRFGEYSAVKLADAVLTVSPLIQRKVSAKRNSGVYFIPSGLEIEEREDKSTLKKYNLEKNGYFFVPARYTEEKNLDIIIKAYREVNTEKKLFICGEISEERYYNYLNGLKELSYNRNNKFDSDLQKISPWIYQDIGGKVTLNGPVLNEEFEHLFSSAYAYINSSSIEGLSQSLLQAVKLKIPCVLSDIEENRIIFTQVKNEIPFYNAGSFEELKEKLEFILIKKNHTGVRETLKNINLSEYNWDRSAKKLEEIYSTLLQK
ncbi:MAG: glycosyltransferase family 4 protein, partial [Actinomycetia bacterium]|nr:glycosyltransferase family 4 protein [Actinomycetes bacterium]